MKLISCHDGKLHALDPSAYARSSASMMVGGGKTFRTGLAALDALPPGGVFARGAVHELLSATADGTPTFFAAWLAQCAARRDKETRAQGDKGIIHPALVPSSPCALVSLSSFPGAVIWSDPRHELYPPALAALGIPLERLFLLHPSSPADHVWAVAECLRCRGVAAVVAALPQRHRLSRVEARRLQLAAERGGGVGLLLRTDDKAADEHAAVTRWLVRPAKGERNVQRWRIQLVFGHGGRVGQSIILEHHRDPKSLPPHVEAHPLHPAAELVDRPAMPPAGRATG